jgi:hypothetical protein
LFPPAKDTKKNFNSSEKEPSAMLPPNNACVFAQPKFGEPFDRSQEDMNAPKAMAPNIQPSAALMSASHQAFPFLDQSQQLAAQLILLAKAEMLQPPIDSVCFDKL